MPCSAPLPLTEDALDAALDGGAPLEVWAHLSGCPGCMARLDHARQFEHAMAMTLRRWECPPATQLGAYHWGLLAPEQARALAAHLADCPRCREEVAELRIFLAEEAAPVAPRAATPPPVRQST
jgi:anti-sigma factor RsiW